MRAKVLPARRPQGEAEYSAVMRNGERIKSWEGQASVLWDESAIVREVAEG